MAPFKAQNMALNAFVTPDGGEIGRAQAVQAQAARVAIPHVDADPILLKPEGDARSQVVVLGKSIGSFAAADYHAKKPELRGLVRESLERSGSKSSDLRRHRRRRKPRRNQPQGRRHREHVRRRDRRCAGPPRGGHRPRRGLREAFVRDARAPRCSHERARMAGFLVNKFRGDLRLLDPGLRFLEGRTGIPVLRGPPLPATPADRGRRLRSRSGRAPEPASRATRGGRDRRRAVAPDPRTTTISSRSSTSRTRGRPPRRARGRDSTGLTSWCSRGRRALSPTSDGCARRGSPRRSSRARGSANRPSASAEVAR